MDSNLLQDLNPYGFIEEVAFSLETGHGYSHCFSGFREEGDFQDEWGGYIRGTLRGEGWSRYPSRSVQLKAGVFPGTPRVAGSTACSARDLQGGFFDLVPRTHLFCAWNKTDTSHLSLLRWAALSITFLGRVCISEAHFLISGEMRKWGSPNVFPSETVLQIVVEFPGSFMESV